MTTELVGTVMERNSPEVATNCLRTIVTYLNNIIKVKSLVFFTIHFQTSFFSPTSLPFLTPLPGPHGEKIPND